MKIAPQPASLPQHCKLLKGKARLQRAQRSINTYTHIYAPSTPVWVLAHGLRKRWRAASSCAHRRWPVDWLASSRIHSASPLIVAGIFYYCVTKSIAISEMLTKIHCKVLEESRFCVRNGFFRGKKTSRVWYDICDLYTSPISFYLPQRRNLV